MLYINDQSKYKTYDEVVDATLKTGIDPKRVYIYLASRGVRGLPGRVLDDEGLNYLPVQKLAVQGGEVIRDLRVCKGCLSIVFVVK